jgi:photosystem II stability/assembly factor-like uncharacterized protein
MRRSVAWADAVARIGGSARVRRPRTLTATSMLAALVLALALAAGGSGTLAFGAASVGAASPSAGSRVISPAVPAGFHAQSLSFVSPMHGWMLGSATCGTGTCTTVIGTTDGGATWHRVGTLPAPLVLEDRTGVTEVRFADDLHGWAFDPAMWATQDGGATWTRQATPGDRPAVALAGNSHAAYAVISACEFNRPISDCDHRATLYRTTPGQGSWERVPFVLPVANQASLAVRGTVAYLVVPVEYPDPDVLASSVDGGPWTSRPDPCNKAHDEFLIDAAPVSHTRVAFLCVGDPGFSKAVKRVVRSNDAGRTTASSTGTMPLLGIVSQLAAAPNGTLAVSSYSSGSWIYRNTGGEGWTTVVDGADGGLGWNDITFTTDQLGFVIHGPAASPGHPGELWKTQDGGLTWTPA